MDSPGDSIEYTYDAAGMKLRQKVFEGGNPVKTTDYVGEFIYEAQGSGPSELQFIQHEEGRIIPETEMVYQYHLKDHLGNVRTTFTTKSYLSGYLATMEDATYTNDTTHFFNIDPRVPYPAPVGGKASRLNSSWPIGPGFYRPVSRGDTIDISVKAYYEDATGWGTNSAPLATLAGALTTAYGGLNGGNEGQQLIYNVFNVFAGGALAIGGTGSDTYPAAYLNYLVFDSDYNLTGQSGFVGMPQGANLEWLLSAQDLVIQQAGYVYIYVSYESTSLQYVFFDNLDVAISESPILESSDYYPFGLTFNAYTKPGTTDQRWKFQGQEHISDLGLNWDQFKWRNADPALGRFFSVDPLADKFVYNSPYAFSENKVTSGIELEGLEHVSHTIYNVHQNSQGKYQAKYNTTLTQKNAGNFNGIRNETQFHVFGNDGNVSAIYAGANSTRDLNAAGIEISSFEHRNVSASEIIDGAINNEEFQRAGETLNNAVTVAGMAIAGPGLISEQLVVQVASGASILNGADDLSGSVTENGNTMIQNQLGKQNGSLLKMGLNIMGAIVGGTSAAQNFIDKEKAEGVVNTIGTAIELKGAIENADEIFEY